MATATAKTTAKTPKAADPAAAFEHVTAASTEALRGNIDRSLAAVSEMGAFSKENMEAIVASATATQKGVEALSARAVAYGKTSMENYMAATRAMMTCKSVQELMERQADFTRASFDSYVAELNALSEMMAGVTKDAIKPLNERMSAMSSLMQTGMGAR